MLNILKKTSNHLRSKLQLEKLIVVLSHDIVFDDIFKDHFGQFLLAQRHL